MKGLEANYQSENVKSQEEKDDYAFSLLMDVVRLAKADKSYKLELKLLGGALKESPKAMELAKEITSNLEAQRSKN